ncbi:hypothetical protein LJB42_000703 [Komagataella kurtzmanii]|nr:hypothetical protein LJB42_000703 [Komagataella kurtzmanii]
MSTPAELLSTKSFSNVESGTAEESLPPSTTTPSSGDSSFINEKLFPSIKSASTSPSSNGSRPVWVNETPASSNLPKKSNSVLRSQNVQDTFTIDNDQQSFQLSKAEIQKAVGDLKNRLNVRIESTISVRTGARTFLISGLPENVKQARREILRKLCKPVDIEFKIPSKARSAVIGPQGKTLKPILDATNAKIDIEKDDNTSEKSEEPGSDEDDIFGPLVTVKVQGDVESCELAKSLIFDIVNKHTLNTSVRIPLAKALRPLVTPVISQLELPSTVEVLVPEINQGVSNIIVSGPTLDVIKARNVLREIIESVESSVVSESKTVPKVLHQYLDADDIFKETGVSVSIPNADDPSAEVVFFGDASNIPNAVALAKSQTKNYSSYSLDISKAHGGNFQHAQRLAAYFRFTSFFDKLAHTNGVLITSPFFNELVSDDSKSLNVTFSGKASEPEKLQQVKKEIINKVNSIPPSSVRAIDDVNAFFFDRIDQKAAKEKNVALIPLGKLAGVSNLLVLVANTTDDEDFLPSQAEIDARLDKVEESLAKWRQLSANLEERVVEVPENEQKLISTKTLNHLTEKFENTIIINLNRDADGYSADKLVIVGKKEDVDEFITEIQKFIEELKDYENACKYTTEILFPVKLLSLLIGQKGHHLDSLREEFDVQVSVESGRDREHQDEQQEVPVKLVGLKANCDACIKKISALQKEWADRKTGKITVEKKYLGSIIGRNGTYVKRFRERYNVQLRVDDGEAEYSDIILVGPSKGVTKALGEIKEFVDYERQNGVTDSITIPKKALSSVIGRSGQTIREISEETGVKITRHGDDEASDESNKSGEKFYLVGTKKGIKDARLRIEEIVKRVENRVKKTVSVERKYHKDLIGPHGSTLREIIRKAGANVDESQRVWKSYLQVPSVDSESTEIISSGEKAIVEKVISQVKELVGRLESNTTEKITVPRNRHMRLIGYGGSVKNELMEEFKVAINIPKKGSDSEVITISGAPEDIEKVKVRIEELTK